MSIAPIVCTITVKAAPARAFELFASHIGEWWSKGSTIGKKPHVTIIIEPRKHGRWFERDADGAETAWGKVLAFEPPTRLVLGMEINSQFAQDPGCLTEVELNFMPAEGGGTKVRLEHRNLERFGEDAEKMAAALSGGWNKHLGELADYALAQA